MLAHSAFLSLTHKCKAASHIKQPHLFKAVIHLPRLPHKLRVRITVVRLPHWMLGCFKATSSDVRLPHQLLRKLTNCEAASPGVGPPYQFFVIQLIVPRFAR